MSNFAFMTFDSPRAILPLNKFTTRGAVNAAEFRNAQFTSGKQISRQKDTHYFI